VPRKPGVVRRRGIAAVKCNLRAPESVVQDLPSFRDLQPTPPMGFFRAFKRVFIWLGLTAEQATETDAINQAVVERGIRDAKAKAEKAHYANGQLAGQVALLKDQVKRQERQRDELQGLLQAAAAANDEANGAHYAEELAAVESEITENKAQLENLENLYQQNTGIIANSLREIQKFQREFEAVKAKVAVGRSLENLAGMMKGSITELQGMMGGELGQSMQQLRQSAASGEGQMRATLDLAKEMGSSIQRQQEMRKARGAMLFKEYQKKMNLAQPATTTPAATPARQKIAE
jgi:putative sterol carrier protein